MIPILEGVSPFARRALRERAPGGYLLVSLALTGLCCAISGRMVLAAHGTVGTALAWADGVCLALLAVLALIAAPAVAWSAMAQELRSGTAEQLRLLPLGPGGLLLGVAVGSPAPVYLFCAGPALGHVLLGLLSGLPLPAVLLSLAMVAAGSLAYGLLWTGLALCTPQQRTGPGAGALVSALLVGLNISAVAMTASADSAGFAYLAPLGGVAALYIDAGHALAGDLLLVSHAPAWLALVPIGALLWSALIGVLGATMAVRKLGDPEVPALSKAQAVTSFYGALLALAAPVAIHRLALPQGSFSRHDLFFFGNIALFGYLPALMIFAAAASPGREKWLRHLRSRDASPWAPGAPPYAAVGLMALGLFGLALFLWGPGSLGWLCGCHPLPGGTSVMGLWKALAIWAWMVLLISVGAQVSSAVLTTMGARVALVLAMVGAVIAMLICSAQIDAFDPRPGLLVPLLGALPLGLFAYERLSARHLVAQRQQTQP